MTEYPETCDEPTASGSFIMADSIQNELKMTEDPKACDEPTASGSFIMADNIQHT